MPLPPLTHLQFLVLDALHASTRSGAEIRDRLAEHGVKKSTAAFYQLMSRLEDARFVKGWLVNATVDGYPVRERHYKILAKGSTARIKTLEFYTTEVANSPVAN